MNQEMINELKRLDKLAPKWGELARGNIGAGHALFIKPSVDADGFRLGTDYETELVYRMRQALPALLELEQWAELGEKLAIAMERIQAFRKVDTSKAHWRCVCGAIAMPLTDDTPCFCEDLYSRDWKRVEDAESAKRKERLRIYKEEREGWIESAMGVDHDTKTSWLEVAEHFGDLLYEEEENDTAI